MKFDDVEVGDLLVNPFGFPMDDEKYSTEVYYVYKRESDIAYAYQITWPSSVKFPFWDKDTSFEWEELRIVKSDEEKAFILLQLENYCHG